MFPSDYLKQSRRFSNYLKTEQKSKKKMEKKESKILYPDGIFLYNNLTNL